MLTFNFENSLSDLTSISKLALFFHILIPIFSSTTSISDIVMRFHRFIKVTVEDYGYIVLALKI